MPTERYAHGVIDLETTGNTSRAPIVQIGLSLPKVDSGFYSYNVKITYEGSDYEFLEDKSTLDWWNKQDDLVREMVFSDHIDGIPRLQLTEALDGFLSYIETYVKNNDIDTLSLWSHATFDPPILIHALQQAGGKYLSRFRKLVHYRSLKDFRTTDWIIGPANKGFVYDVVDKITAGMDLKHHYAPDDAYYEHLILREQMKLLREALEGSYIDTSHLHIFGEVELPEERPEKN